MLEKVSPEGKSLPVMLLIENKWGIIIEIRIKN